MDRTGISGIRKLGVTGVPRGTNPITMGIFAVTRAAETCDRCDNPSHACRGGGGLSVGRPATVSRARQKCRPPPHDGQAPCPHLLALQSSRFGENIRLSSHLANPLSES